MDSREALIALNMLEHVGPVRLRQLLQYFGDAPAILQASRQQLLSVTALAPRLPILFPAGKRTSISLEIEAHSGIWLSRSDAGR
jgi:predicted Rossmann fold nucleotide-binding protein DprA/Smf involved in DNA uptake